MVPGCRGPVIRRGVSGLLVVGYGKGFDMGGKARKRTIPGVENAGCDSHAAFRWCDLNCPHASWPEEGAVDGSGTCRTFLALYCSRLRRYVSKNAPCTALHGARRPKSSW